jgi:O-antigen/teichoic acid export membrane protein
MAATRGLLTGLNILGHRKLFVSLTNLIPWGGIALSVLLVVHYQGTAEMWLAGQVVAHGIAGLLAVMLFFRKLSATHGQEHGACLAGFQGVPGIARFAWPISISVGLYWMQSQGYRFVLFETSGASAVGIFAIGYAIGAALMIAFETVFSQFYLPAFYKEISNASEAHRVAAWNRYASAFLPAVVVMVAMVASGGQFFVWLLADKEFQGAASVVALAALAEGLRMVSSTYYMAAVAEKNMKLLILPGLAGALVASVGVWLFAPINALLGTGFALCLAALVQVMTMMSQFTQYALALPGKRLIFAGLAVVPLSFGLQVGGTLLQNQAVPSIVILGAALVYVAILQWRLAREWLL